MAKIVKYMLVHQDDTYLDEKVNLHLKHGWQPYGSLIYDGSDKEKTICQAMVKYED